MAVLDTLSALICMFYAIYLAVAYREFISTKSMFFYGTQVLICLLFLSMHSVFAAESLKTMLFHCAVFSFMNIYLVRVNSLFVKLSTMSKYNVRETIELIMSSKLPHEDVTEVLKTIASGELESLFCRMGVKHDSDKIVAYVILAVSWLTIVGFFLLATLENFNGV